LTIDDSRLTIKTFRGLVVVVVGPRKAISNGRKTPILGVFFFASDRLGDGDGCLRDPTSCSVHRGLLYGWGFGSQLFDFPKMGKNPREERDPKQKLPAMGALLSSRLPEEEKLAIVCVLLLAVELRLGLAYSRGTTWNWVCKTIMVLLR
jgi:hypothetical protein